MCVCARAREWVSVLCASSQFHTEISQVDFHTWRCRFYVLIWLLTSLQIVVVVRCTGEAHESERKKRPCINTKTVYSLTYWHYPYSLATVFRAVIHSSCRCIQTNCMLFYLVFLLAQYCECEIRWETAHRARRLLSIVAVLVSSSAVLQPR